MVNFITIRVRNVIRADISVPHEKPAIGA